MKKFILALAALSMIATPAMAQGRDHRWGVDSNRHSPYYGQTRGHHRDYDRGHRRHRGVSTGEAVAIGIGALILGAAISSNNKNRRQEPEVREYQYYTPPVPRQVCETIETRDRYGNFLNRQTICYNQ